MSKSLIAVCSGGFLGGGFWLLTQITGAATLALPFTVYLYALIGGIIAAGLATYVPSDVDLTKVEKLFFVSAAAGLSFPSVISTAVTAEDVARIRGTNKQVEKRVEAIQQQISAPTTNPAEVAQAVTEAGSTLSAGPASPAVKQSYDSISIDALNSLSSDAKKASDPTAYVQAIQKIGTVNAELGIESAERLAELSKSQNPKVSAAAEPALGQQLEKLSPTLKDAVAASVRPEEQQPPAQ